jgi:hypothetical protein
MNNLRMLLVVALLVLLALAAGREVTGLDSEQEIIENSPTLSSDPEWRYAARTDGTVTLLDYDGSTIVGS